MADSETAAIAKVAEALSDLDPEAVARILRWAADKYNVGLTSKHKQDLDDSRRHSEADSGNIDRDYKDFADLYDAANPPSENERVLVAGYWLQVIEKAAEWDSRTANDLLKNLGHPVSNIASSLRRLQEQTPRLAMQTIKTGKSKQSRKRYKLTTEGTRTVSQLIDGPSKMEAVGT